MERIQDPAQVTILFIFQAKTTEADGHKMYSAVAHIEYFI